RVTWIDHTCERSQPGPCLPAGAAAAFAGVSNGRMAAAVAPAVPANRLRRVRLFIGVSPLNRVVLPGLRASYQFAIAPEGQVNAGAIRLPARSVSPFWRIPMEAVVKQPCL